MCMCVCACICVCVHVWAVGKMINPCAMHDGFTHSCSPHRSFQSERTIQSVAYRVSVCTRCAVLMCPLFFAFCCGLQLYPCFCSLSLTSLLSVHVLVVNFHVRLWRAWREGRIPESRQLCAWPHWYAGHGALFCAILLWCCACVRSPLL